MADVTLAGVTKRFDGGADRVIAVDAVDLDIADGEFLVLVGPSGCGKSTLLRMVAGLELPDAGSIRIGGRDVTRLQPKDRDIAMVFQSYALYSHKTVRGNIAYPLQLAKVPRTEVDERVEATAARLHLEELLDRRPGQLSGGQRQRVAMARALVRQPKAFLMDEPLSNLDAKLRVEMRAEIARLQRSTGVTTLYVTHDQVEAMTMGDRAAVLDRGRLQQVGTPQELYDRPDSVFVATFIGSPAMNLFPAPLLGPEIVPGVAAGVLVGLRPEAFTDAALDTGVPGDRVVEVEIELVEARGPELVVHGQVSGRDGSRAPLVARLTPKSRLRPGDVVKLTVDTDQVHFFDADSGAALRSPP